MTINIKKTPNFSATGGMAVRGTGGGVRVQPLPPTGTPIVTSGLIAWLDASSPASYPGSGTTIYDRSGQGANGTMNGTVSWVSNGQASYWSFTRGDANDISSTVTANYADMTIVFEPDFSIIGGAQISGLVATGPATYSTPYESLRLGGVDGSGPWYIPNPGNGDDWVYNNNGTSLYKNGTPYAYNNNVTLSSGWNIIGGARANDDAGFSAPWAYHLGTSGYPGRNFQGKIAVVLLYSSALTQLQQEQNFEALRGRFGL